MPAKSQGVGAPEADKKLKAEGILNIGATLKHSQTLPLASQLLFDLAAVARHLVMEEV